MKCQIEMFYMFLYPVFRLGGNVSSNEHVLLNCFFLPRQTLSVYDCHASKFFMFFQTYLNIYFVWSNVPLWMILIIKKLIFILLLLSKQKIVTILLKLVCICCVGSHNSKVHKLLLFKGQEKTCCFQIHTILFLL